MSRERRRARYAKRVEAALLAAIEAGRIDAGEVYTIDIAHDDWCRGLVGAGPCNCNPAIGPIRKLREGPLADYAISHLDHHVKGR